MAKLDRPDQAQRLVQARERRFKTPTDACRYFSWNYDTYIQHERGERGLTRAAGKYATAFRVSKAWLLTGEGDAEETLVRVAGRIGANPEGGILYAQADEPNIWAPPPPGGSAHAVAVEVAGHSMKGWADDGALIYYEDRREPPTPDLLGEVVVVWLDTDEVLVKRLLRGSRKGRYDLESAVGPTIHDARVKWAAEITAIIPPRQARRIIIHDR